MAQFIAPKSDQINADDLIGGPLTITITRVSANESAPEQPINIFFQGDGGKPFRPCKSMRRVMVHVWGSDASKYAGRSMTLYRDPKVQFGGMSVGGIRISHMSDIPNDKMNNGVVQMSLTATRAKRAPYTVKELQSAPTKDEAAEWANSFIAQVRNVPVVDALDALLQRSAKALSRLQSGRPELYTECQHAIDLKRSEFAPADFAERRPDDAFGDQFDDTDFAEGD